VAVGVVARAFQADHQSLGGDEGHLKKNSPLWFFDTATRLRRVALSGATALFARGLTWAVGLLSLPWASHYLGRERFGLWLTLVGVVNWFSLANLGVTNSLINEVAVANARQDEPLIQRLISNAVVVSSLIVLLIIGAAAWLIPRFDANRFFQLSEPRAQREIAAALFAVSVCFALRLLASVTSGIFTALQQSYLYHWWSIVCGLLSALGLWLAIQTRAGLAGLICGFIGGWLIGECLAAAYLFGWHRVGLIPQLRWFEKETVWRLLNHGFHFWLAQIAAVVLLQTDLLVVSGLFGAQAVAEYGTAMRLFNLVGAVQTAFVAPLWAAYSEAHAQQDYAWVARTFRRSLWVSAAFTLPCVGLIFLSSPWLFSWIVTDDIRPTMDLMVALLVVEVTNALARCLAMLLNGIGLIRIQAIFGPVAGLTNLLLSVWLGRRWGSAGVAWATAICLAAFWLGLMGLTARRQLRQWQVKESAA
jgi:O-antigen/teichoic acid export membrane protein